MRLTTYDLESNTDEHQNFGRNVCRHAACRGQRVYNDCSKWNGPGFFTQYAEQNVNASGLLNQPEGTIVNANGQQYIANIANAQILKATNANLGGLSPLNVGIYATETDAFPVDVDSNRTGSRIVASNLFSRRTVPAPSAGM